MIKKVPECPEGLRNAPMGVVKIAEPCEFGRKGSRVDGTGNIAEQLFRAQLECYKTNPYVTGKREKIIDYRFEGVSGEGYAGTQGGYAIQVEDLSMSKRFAGDGIRDGSWTTGKTLMFISIHAYCTDVFTMSHGTGP